MLLLAASVNMSARQWLGAWAAITVVWCMGLAHGSIFPNRRAANPCSLAGSTACGLTSVYGRSGEHNGMLMTFGETDCKVNLTQCRPNTCYSFLDHTSLLEADAGHALRKGSLFSSIQVLSGARRSALSRHGFAFESDGTSVELSYSTYTCDEFYRYHGRTGIQLCATPFPAISNVGAGLLNSLDCATGAAS